MTHDEHDPSSPVPLDPELETRLAAWIDGEASEAEQANLAVLVAKRPEVARLKKELEEMRALVTHAVRAESAPLRLSAERRSKLLQTLSAKSPVATPRDNTIALPQQSAWWSPRNGRIYVAFAGAAVACVVALLQVAPETTFHKQRVQAFPDPAVHRMNEDARFLESPIARDVEPKYELQAFQVNEARAKDREARERLVAARGSPLSESKNIFAPATSLADDVKKTGERVLGGYGAEQAKRLDGPSVSFGGAAAETTTPPPVSVSFGYVGGIGLPTEKEKTDKASGFGADSITLGAGSVSMLPQPPNNFSRAVGGKLMADANGVRSSEAGYINSNAPVLPPPAESVIKLEAFVVSSDRSWSAAAGVSNAVRNEFDLAAPGLSQLAAAKPAAKAKGNENAPADSKPVAPAPAQTLDQIAAVAPAAKRMTDEDAPAARTPATPVFVVTLNEANAAAEPVSTFSLHVSDVSFRLAQAALARGERPDPSRIRPEEFYNAFSYGDPTPTAAEKIGVRIEQAAHPFQQQRNLVRIAVKVPAAGRGASQPFRLTVLLDTSGSMEREDRAATVRRALGALVSLLRPDDQLTLIGFARQPRLIAEAVAGDKAAEVLNLVSAIPAEGGTDLEAALKLGGEIARRHQLVGAQNRIVVLTDGAANLGNANPEQLATMIETLRQQGIAFDACGIGLDGLDDAVLEALTRKGDGRYYVLDSVDAADAGFARQLAGAFRPAAENAKLQVRFNPARVGHYRLIGFEQHRLRTEDFRNDAVDAAELAAEEAAVALYQVEVLPQGAGELGEVFVRFRDAANAGMVERSWTIQHDPAAAAFDRAAPSLQLAGTAAFIAEKLRGGATAEPIKLRDLTGVVNGLRGHYPHQSRVQELSTMFSQMRQLGLE